MSLAVILLVFVALLNAAAVSAHPWADYDGAKKVTDIKCPNDREARFYMDINYDTRYHWYRWCSGSAHNLKHAPEIPPEDGSWIHIVRSMNDIISAVDIVDKPPPGPGNMYWTLALYTNAEYGQLCIRLTGDHPDLRQTNNGCNDQISSFRWELKGTP
jgi:hypothetical protein